MIPLFTLPSKWALNVSLLLFLLVANGLLPQTLTAQCLTYQTTGLYSFTVPAGGPFPVRITTKGGDGAVGNGGSGATATASFSLQSGDQLTSIVGAVGQGDGVIGGGGGGTAVVLTRAGTPTLLLAAGGGGGGNTGFNYAGGGGQGLGPSSGGAGGSQTGPLSGGGGGGGLDGAGTAGATTNGRAGSGGGQASLTALSAGGRNQFGLSRGGSGFGGGGGGGSNVNDGSGGGGGYGGGQGGDSRLVPNRPQGGYSYLSPIGSMTVLTPGAAGAGTQQDGSVVITFPSSPVSAAITGGNTTVCAGQATTITGTVNAVGTWTIVLNDGTTQSGSGATFSIPVTPPSSTTYSIQCLFDSRGVAQPGYMPGSQVVAVNTPVTITQQPTSSALVCFGTNVGTFVSASGTVSGYQWYRNGGLVSGQTSATLTLPNTTTANSGSYVVVVTGCNSVTSTPFNLTVNSPPSVSLSNNGPLTCAQTSVTLTASGTSGATYAFSGPSGPLTSNDNMARVSSPGTYTVTASLNGCTSTTTTTVSSNTAAPTVSITPSSTAICAGQTATFTASGDPASYSWSSGQTSAMISATAQGTYTVTAINTSNGCSNTATATLTVNEKPVPPTTQPVTVCQNSTPVSLATGITSGANLRWYTQQTGGVGSSVASTPPTSTTGSTTYYVSQLNSSNCESERASITYTVNPLPTPSITGLATAYCQDAAAVTLMGSPAAGASPARGVFTVDGTTATVFNPASLSVGQHTVVYSYTNASGCSATASQLVTVKEVPQTPIITTQPDGSYLANVSSLTISQNTGNVTLGVSGCSGGTITWSGGSSNTLSVSTTSTGVHTFTATCTSNGCTSPVGTATITVVAPTLKVLSRDPDNGQLNNNTIKPYLLLQNAGTTPIAYSNITLRYWLTTENNIPLNFQKNYVAISQGNLNLRYVPINPTRQGATGYIEYSFSGGAGSLAPNGDSGPLEVQVTKQDYSVFNQRDDYSYINNSSFTLNPRITAYQNGVIFYGQEPTGTASARLLVEEAGSELTVKVLGNPVVGQMAEVEISGASGQALQVKLVDLQGKLVHGQSIQQAGSVERVSLPLSDAHGILLLDVSTATQRQQIKLLRP